MPSIECSKHTSVYYNSSVHKKCPACTTEILKQTVARLAGLAIDNHHYGTALLRWFRRELEAISPSLLTKEEAVAQKESAYAKANELSQRITTDGQDLLDYWEKNGLKEILKE